MFSLENDPDIKRFSVMSTANWIMFAQRDIALRMMIAFRGVYYGFNIFLWVLFML
jgi:hypothetical protein